MSTEPTQRPTRKVQTMHAGGCTAVRMDGPCQCPGYLPDTTPVASYFQCICGHTQPSHALIVTSLAPEPSKPRTRAA